jgi:hypothetical protein
VLGEVEALPPAADRVIEDAKVPGSCLVLARFFQHNFNTHTTTTSHLLLVCVVVSTGYETLRFQRLSFTSDRSTSLFLVSRDRAGSISFERPTSDFYL